MKQIFIIVATSILKNCHYWATENPRNIHQKPLHSEKVIVLCGVASFAVIGPCFFEDKAYRAVTVNSAHYTKMLCTFLEPELQRLGVETQILWFQQDGATAHTASPQQDVPSSRDLTKRESSMACKIARSQCLQLLPLGISQEQGVQKETKDNGGLETEHQQFLPPCCNIRCRISRNACRNVLTTRTPPHRHYIQEVNIVIKML
jgi:hypothetical protein